MQYVLKRRIHLKNLLNCYETVGSPTISNGIVSGFSDGNYVQLKRDVSSCDNTEYVIKFTTSSTTTSVVQSIFHWEFVVNFELRADSFTAYTYNWETGGSTDLTTLSANTTYWLKVVLNGNTKSIYLSTDGVDYTQLISFSENGLRPLEYLPSLGDHVTLDRPFMGTIDLNESSVKFNKTYSLKANEKTYVLAVNPDNQTSGETVYYTFAINPTPENAVVTINGQTINSIKLAENSTVDWFVSLDGYKTQTGSLSLNKDTTIEVVLEEEEQPQYACYFGDLERPDCYVYVSTPLTPESTFFCMRDEVGTVSELYEHYTGYTLDGVSEEAVYVSGNLLERYYEGDLYE